MLKYITMCQPLHNLCALACQPTCALLVFTRMHATHTPPRSHGVGARKKCVRFASRGRGYTPCLCTTSLKTRWYSANAVYRTLGRWWRAEIGFVQLFQLFHSGWNSRFSPLLPNSAISACHHGCMSIYILVFQVFQLFQVYKFHITSSST